MNVLYQYVHNCSLSLFNNCACMYNITEVGIMNYFTEYSHFFQFKICSQWLRDDWAHSICWSRPWDVAESSRGSWGDIYSVQELRLCVVCAFCKATMCRIVVCHSVFAGTTTGGQKQSETSRNLDETGCTNGTLFQKVTKNVGCSQSWIHHWQPNKHFVETY